MLVKRTHFLSNDYPKQTHLRINEDIMSQNKTRRFQYGKMTAFHPLIINPDSFPIAKLFLWIPYVLKPLIKHHFACLHHVLLISFYKYCTRALSGTVCNTKPARAFQVEKLPIGNLFGQRCEERRLCSLFC